MYTKRSEKSISKIINIMEMLGFTPIENSKRENLQFYHPDIKVVLDLSAISSDRIALKLFQEFTKLGREQFKESFIDFIQPERLKGV